MRTPTSSASQHLSHNTADFSCREHLKYLCDISAPQHLCSHRRSRAFTNISDISVISASQSLGPLQIPLWDSPTSQTFNIQHLSHKYGDCREYRHLRHSCSILVSQHCRFFLENTDISQVSQHSQHCVTTLQILENTDISGISAFSKYLSHNAVDSS
jgi:hypothetical protein